MFKIERYFSINNVFLCQTVSALDQSSSLWTQAPSLHTKKEPIYCTDSYSQPYSVWLSVCLSLPISSLPDPPDPYLWLKDPDPEASLLVMQWTLGRQQKILSFLIFRAYYFLKLHLHHSKKNCRNTGFLLFLLDDGRIRIWIRNSD